MRDLNDEDDDERVGIEGYVSEEAEEELDLYLPMKSGCISPALFSIVYRQRFSRSHSRSCSCCRDFLGSELASEQESEARCCGDSIPSSRDRRDKSATTSSELIVSLRPALSVDSSGLFSSGSSHVNPLQQQLARLAREEALRTVRHGGSTPDNGQTSLTNAAPHSEPVAHGFPISRVPEEKSWKEGYEHKIVNPLEAPRVPRPSSEAPGRVPRPSSEAPRVPRPSSETTRVLRTSSEAAGILRTGSEAARVMRTSSDGAAVNQLVTARSTDLHSVVDIPDAQPGSSVDLEALRKASAFNAGPGRTISSWSTDSAAEHCRICQQHTEEPLIDLGCACRGEMAKSHKSCIEMWFKNKGTNKCEVCQHEAANITAPPTSPVPHFWVWRLGGPYGAAAAAQQLAQQQQQSATSSRGRLNPLWAALAILTAGLMFDVLISIFLGASALPVNIIIGVLVVLGLGTAVRLVLEYMHEKNMRRRIELLELDPVPEDPAEGSDSSNHATRTPQNGPSVASAV